MNFIAEIKSTLDRSLHICLDDEEIIVHRLGKFDGKNWYSWTVWSPTEGNLPYYGGQLVEAHQILERLTLLMGDEPLEEHQLLGVDLFFGKHVNVEHE
jgi:hypothetical protein